MDYELKPCPFCGGEATLDGTTFVFVVSCVNCNAMITAIGEPDRYNWSSPIDPKLDVIQKWNRRVEI